YSGQDPVYQGLSRIGWPRACSRRQFGCCSAYPAWLHCPPTTAPPDDPARPGAASWEVGHADRRSRAAAGGHARSVARGEHGVRYSHMTGVDPLTPGTKMVGEAVTLRYVPAREDMNAAMPVSNREHPQ